MPTRTHARTHKRMCPKLRMTRTDVSPCESSSVRVAAPEVCCSHARDAVPPSPMIRVSATLSAALFLSNYCIPA